MICKFTLPHPHSMPLDSWSMAKSILQILIGICVQKGTITQDEINQVGVGRWKPEWSGDERGSMTIKDILRMKSGLDFVEAYVRNEDDMPGRQTRRPLY